MKTNLKVGQSFEVVEWIKSPFGSIVNEYKGFQCLKDEYGSVFTPILYNIKNKLVKFSDTVGFDTKPIGKLTITKLK